MAFAAPARRRFLGWGSANIVICLALCILAIQSPQTLDRWDQVLQIGPYWWREVVPWLERPLVWVSNAFGTLATTIVTAVVAGVLVAKKQVRAAAYLVLVIAGTSLVTNLLKVVVELPRPEVEDAILVYDSSAMPSGHASNIAAAVTAASVLAAIFVLQRAVRSLALVVGVLVALVVGLDRLMLGVHTLTEVVAGYTLGVGFALLTTYFFDPAVRLAPEAVASASE